MKPLDQAHFENAAPSPLDPIHNPINVQRYRECAAKLNLPAKDLDALIVITHRILSHFVDAAFHVQTDQITLAAVKEKSNAPSAADAIGHRPDNPIAHANSHHGRSDANQRGSSEP